MEGIDSTQTWDLECIYLPRRLQMSVSVKGCETMKEAGVPNLSLMRSNHPMSSINKCMYKYLFCPCIFLVITVSLWLRAVLSVIVSYMGNKAHVSFMALVVAELKC